MRKLFIIPLTVFMMGVLLISCQKEDDSIKTTNEIAVSSDEKILWLQQNGFQDEEITYLEDEGVFDMGDARVFESDVDARMSQTNSKVAQQRRTLWLVDDANVEDINVFITSSVSSSYQDAIVIALQKWNDIPLCKINFTIVTSSSDADITVTTFNDPNTNVVAWAYYPFSSGVAGNEVSINTKYEYFSSTVKINTMLHEFGHTIGLRHTNTTDGTHITGTPTSDPSSVMQSYVQAVSNFSNGDILAARTLYPTDIPSTTGIPNGFKKYSNVHTLGTGGPNLNNVFNSVFNWWGNQYNPNGLYQFTLETNNNTPRSYTNIPDYGSYSIYGAQPEISINSSIGFAGLDGNYWVVLDGENLVLVDKLGAYALYFSNSSVAPNLGITGALDLI